ncbi:MAG: hypothetical protein VYA84_17405 [Planctomycetota bacterium]|nr:hypothetical protein [Planctomycetota bacterium]
MSLPNELREQLLSGHLDDVLSADERARVDYLLANDPEFADDLEQLREIQAILAAISSSEDEIRLESGFAGRILDAAVAQARFEGLNEDHPLLRLAEQPSLQHTKRSAEWRVPVTIAAVAATIALAFFAVDFGKQQDPIAKNPASKPSSLEDEPVSDGIEKTLPAEPRPAMLAEGPAPTGGNVEEKIEAVASVPVITPEIAAQETPETASSTTEIPETSVASAESIPPATAARQNSIDEQMLLGGSPLMVYSVQLTKQGKETDAVNAALANAEIGATRQQKVSEEIAGFFTENKEESSEATDARVLYLDAPLKNLDRFYLSLMADEEGIAQVGMSIAFNTPMKRVVDSLNVNPTTVRHDGRVFELVGNATVISQIAAELDELPFSFNRSNSLKIQNDGPDEMGQLLLLIQP